MKVVQFLPHHPDKNMPPLTFKPFTDNQQGTILILKQFYKELAKIKPEYFLEWEKDWIEYDREIF